MSALGVILELAWRLLPLALVWASVEWAESSDALNFVNKMLLELTSTASLAAISSASCLAHWVRVDSRSSQLVIVVVVFVLLGGRDDSALCGEILAAPVWLPARLGTLFGYRINLVR